MSKSATRKPATPGTKKVPEKSADATEESTTALDDDRLRFGERLRIRLGYAGTRTFYNGIRLVMLVGFGFVGYLVTFLLAVRGVPNLMAAVQQGTGVTMKMPLDVVIAGWIVPSLFLVAMLFVLLLVALRQLWRFGVRLTGRLERSLFSLDRDADSDARPANRPARQNGADDR